jgi:hypothetical protein
MALTWHRTPRAQQVGMSWSHVQALTQSHAHATFASSAGVSPTGNFGKSAPFPSASACEPANRPSHVFGHFNCTKASLLSSSEDPPSLPPERAQRPFRAVSTVLVTEVELFVLGHRELV